MEGFYSIFDACQLSGILFFSVLAIRRILIRSDYTKLSFCSSHAVFAGENLIDMFGFAYYSKYALIICIESRLPSF